MPKTGCCHDGVRVGARRRMPHYPSRSPRIKVASGRGQRRGGPGTQDEDGDQDGGDALDGVGDRDMDDGPGETGKATGTAVERGVGG